MSQIVFILGAGASRDCGAPLMYDFLDTASRLLSTNDVAGKNEHFERVFKAIACLQAVHSKAQIDLNNIESIFTALEIANVLGKLPGFEPEEIPLVISSLKEMIVITLERTISFPTDGNFILATKTYEKFSNLLHFLNFEAHPNLTTSVITFNYDIALDMAMYRKGLGPLYGLGASSNSNNPILLMKLHGSLNWAVRSDSEIKTVQTLSMHDYLQKYTLNGWGSKSGTCKIPIGSQVKEYYEKHTDIRVSAEPVIVPPAWNKADYHQFLSKIWGTAAKELEEAEYIFIVGYSLPETDAFFKLLYGLGTVGQKLLKKLVIYNPDVSGVVEARFKNMIGSGALARFEYKPLKFSESIDDVKSFFPARK